VHYKKKVIKVEEDFIWFKQFLFETEEWVEIKVLNFLHDNPSPCQMIINNLKFNVNQKFELDDLLSYLQLPNDKKVG
jgi:hypothetical protein